MPTASEQWNALGRRVFPVVAEFRDSRAERSALRAERSAERVARSERLSSPIVQHSEQFVGLGDSSNARAILGALRGAAATANRVVRNRVQGLELGVYVRRFRDGQVIDTPAFDHPLQHLLDNPTTDADGVVTHTASQLWGTSVTHYNSVGEAYSFVIHDGSGMPINLQLARAGTVRPIRSSGRLVGYEVGTGATRVQVLPRDVLRIWEPDPDDPLAAKGVMAHQSAAINLEQHTAAHWEQFYKNDATPKIAFEHPDTNEGYPNKSDMEGIHENWFKKYHRIAGQRMGLPVFVKAGWKIKELSSQNEAASGVTMMKHSTSQVYQGYGVAGSMVGEVVDVNRSTAETARFVFDTNTILPITKMFSDCITSQLASQYLQPNPDVRLIVKYRPFLADDKEFELKRDEVDLKMKIRTANEVRETREPELPAAAWGNLPIGTFNEVPYTGDEPEDFDLSGFGLNAPAPDAGEDEDEPRQQRASEETLKRRAHFTPELEWQRQLARDARWTPKFHSAQQQAFKQQEGDTIGEFYKSGRMRSQLSKGGIDAAKARAVAMDLAEEIFPVKGWETLFSVTTERVRKAAFKASAGQALKAITGETFIMTETARATLLEQNLLHLEFVNQTTRSQLAQVLGEAVANGSAVDETAREISKVFGKRFKDARRIARTEIAGAVSEAQIEGYRQSGVVEQKQWNNSLDADVRDSHQVDGQVVDLEGSFTLGNGARASGPGDPALSAGDRANCRCFTTPVFTDEVIDELGTAGSGVSGF